MAMESERTEELKEADIATLAQYRFRVFWRDELEQETD